MVGHSMGGDISMYFAKQYPDEIKKVVTLDNLRVPFLTDGKFKILSFRSKDSHFKPDPGVVPDDEQCEQAGITVVNTGFQHNDMRDTGPDAAKSSIQSMLDKFIDESDKSGALKPVPTKVPDVLSSSPGPVPLSVPLASNPAPNKPVTN
jgi:pimeloyl-ACP methyl ester carboxylesterase